MTITELVTLLNTTGGKFVYAGGNVYKAMKSDLTSSVGGWAIYQGETKLVIGAVRLNDKGERFGPYRRLNAAKIPQQ